MWFFENRIKSKGAEGVGSNPTLAKSMAKKKESKTDVWDVIVAIMEIVIAVVTAIKHRKD